MDFSNFDFTIIWAALIAFIGVVLLIPPVSMLAVRLGFVDQPGGRKRHEALIPPVGGLIIFPVFIVVAIVFGADLARYWPLFTGIAVLLGVGAVDDKLQINAWIKFAAQIGVSFFVVFIGGAELTQLGDLFGFGTLYLGWGSWIFSVAAVALLINAVNLMDGLDGLAGGTSFVVLSWLVVACIVAGAGNDLMVLSVIAAALLAFLIYNIRHPWRVRASIFLGDSGALSLGLVLAWFCITLAKEGTQVIEPISVAWVLALPIIDTCAQFYRRVREGRHPFSPDRGHFHHHLVHAGVAVKHATPVILFIVFGLGAIGYVGAVVGVPLYILTFAWMGLLFAHMVLSHRPEIYVSFFGRFLPKGEK